MTLLYLIIGIALFVLTMGWLSKRQRKARAEENELKIQQIKDVVSADFKAMDVIAHSMRWLGSESEIVDAKFPWYCEYGFTQKLLCKTSKKQWFVVEYRMNGSTVDCRTIYQSDEQTARSWLEYDRTLYTKHFDLPEIA